MFDPETTDWNIIFRALADERRRMILQFMFTHAEDVPVEELAEHLQAEAVPGTDGQMDVESYVAYIHHSALPALADANLVNWEPNEESVTLTQFAYRLPVGTLSPEAVPFEGDAIKQRADD